MDSRSRAAVTSTDPRVQAALQNYLGRIDRGEQIEVEAFVAQHADVADELRSFIALDEEARRLARGAAPKVDSPNADGRGIKPPRSKAEVSTHSIVGQTEGTVSGRPRPPGSPPGVPSVTKSPDDLPEAFGRYRVKQKLGKGTMGAVYLAEDSLLQRKVALKTPTFEGDEDGELLRRFHREARAVASLKHPNLCAVYDVGEIDGRHYISMEFVPGKKLQEFINPGKPLTEKQAMAVVRKIALGMHEAHTHGVIHRDLKPDNIMVNEKGEPVVMDFGLVHKTDQQNSTKITQRGTLVGSPAYMSKEQVEGDPDKLTGATDQYSLGVILYQLLTSKLPFEGGIHAVLGAILTKEPPPPSQHRPDLNPHLEAVCRKMMAKAAQDRYPSMKAAADALAEVAKGTSQAAGNAIALRPADRSPGDAFVSTITLGPEFLQESVASAFDIERNDERPPRRKTIPRGRPSQPPRSVLYGSLAAGLILLLAVTLWFRNGDVLVKVEVLTNDIEVLFQKDTITLKDGQKEVKAKPGDHTLHITSGDVEFDTDKFTLKRGVNPVVTVELIKSEIVAKLGELELGRHTLQPVAKQPPAVHQEGDWRIEDGELITEGVPFQSQRLVFGDPAWKDYNFKVETRIDRFDDQGMEHMIEFLNSDGPDGQSHWTLDFGGWGPKNVDLRAVVPGEDPWRTASRRWMGGQMHGEFGKWYAIEIRVRQDQVTVIVDGTTLASSQHSALTHGRIGVATQHSGRCRWRKFDVRAVDGTVLWSGLPKLNEAQRPVSQLAATDRNASKSRPTADTPQSSPPNAPTSNVDGFVYPINGNEPTRWKFARNTGWNKGNRKGVWQIGAADVEPAQPAQFIVDRPGNQLVCEQMTDDIYTEKSYGDVRVELEFMIPKDSNSGIFLMGEYEININDFDSSGHIISGPPPKVVARKPAGTWQSFDITFRAPRFDAVGKKTADAILVAVRYNGSLIHENVTLSGVSRDPSMLVGKEAATGPLLLQGSIGPVAYRNIRIKELTND